MAHLHLLRVLSGEDGGSRVVARPAADGRVEVGGRTILDVERHHPLP
ncbi:MAG: hypothetical protein H0U84_07425 [Thermoleophilaceae bacterium]|nr:hypothetical protein [Thermoleophilaceae bacterium]